MIRKGQDSKKNWLLYLAKPTFHV